MRYTTLTSRELKVIALLVFALKFCTFLKKFKQNKKGKIKIFPSLRFQWSVKFEVET